MEWKLQGDFPSTFEFHENRERADHLSDWNHNRRLKRAARIIQELQPESVSDLGCGDGGLLLAINGANAWGYDFTPANVEAAREEREVDVVLKDVFNNRHVPDWGELVVMTEVLEHLANPHEVLAWVSENCRWVLVSSPWGENPDNSEGFDPCHIWAWDFEGYSKLLSEHFTIQIHEKCEWSQIILAETKFGK